jgi:hypothetical protein
MGDLLEEALQQAPPQRKTQLQYILHQLNQDIGQEMQDSEDEGQEDDEDDEVMVRIQKWVWHIPTSLYFTDYTTG